MCIDTMLVLDWGRLQADADAQGSVGVAKLCEAVCDYFLLRHWDEHGHTRPVHNTRQDRDAIKLKFRVEAEAAGEVERAM